MTAEDAQSNETEQERYGAHVARLMPAYREGRYADALALVRGFEAEVPTYRSDIAHTAACLLGLLGRPEEAYDEFRAAFAAGGWWAREMLEQDEDLAGLRDLPGFADLVDSAERRREEQGDSTTLPVVLKPTDGTARGTLVALHGAGDDGPRAAQHWRPLTTRGVGVVAPTSSQRPTPMRHSWMDLEVGSRDIGAALTSEATAELVQRPIIAAGFSAGGRQALHWALTGEPVAVQGFLLLCPSVRTQQVEPWLPKAAEGGLRGHVIVGADDWVLAEVETLVIRLCAEGIETGLEVVDGVGHEYPADLGDRAGAALDRLLVGG